MMNLSNAIKDALHRHQLEETDLLCLQISDEVLDRIVAGRKRVDFRGLTEYYEQLLFPSFDESLLSTRLSKPFRVVLYQSTSPEGTRSTLVRLPQIHFNDEERQLYERSESPVIIDYYGTDVSEMEEMEEMADIVGDEIAQEAYNEGLEDGDPFFAILLGEVLLDEDPRRDQKEEHWRQIREEGPQFEQLIDPKASPLPEEVAEMLRQHNLAPEEVLRLEVKRSHFGEILKDKCYLAILAPTSDFMEAILVPGTKCVKPYQAILFETRDEEPTRYALTSLFLPTEDELEEGMPDEPLVIVYHGDSKGEITTPEDTLGVTLAAAVYERGLVERDDFAVIPTNELLASL